MTSDLKQTILIADDDESLRRVLEFQLKESGYDVLTAADGLQAFELFKSFEVACVITDLRMPKLSGLDLLERIRAIDAEKPVIMITAFGEVETAVSAMRSGAFDYITKPFNKDEIFLTIEKAINFSRTFAENRRLRQLVNESFSLKGLIGNSPSMIAVLSVIERVSRSDATVLITGETGTGKELVAKGIHFAGKRAEKPFIPINCGAIPESLIESELFGHRKGAFTSAAAEAKGKFEEASGGTLFLDEISEMPLALQPKLLRVLQEQEIVRLGESQPRKVDVRIIAAANQNLEKCVKEGSFREDLYFRLAVVPVHLPPLRERREDIPLLVKHFLRRAEEKHGFTKLQVDREVFNALLQYSFHGNVRELENTIERMVVLSDGQRLTVRDLPENIQNPQSLIGNLLAELPPEGISLEDLEKEIIGRALDKHNGNQSQTARYLNLTRSALIYRMQKYGLADAPEN